MLLCEVVKLAGEEEIRRCKREVCKVWASTQKRAAKSPRWRPCVGIFAHSHLCHWRLHPRNSKRGRKAKASGAKRGDNVRLVSSWRAAASRASRAVGVRAASGRFAGVPSERHVGNRVACCLWSRTRMQREREPPAPRLATRWPPGGLTALMIAPVSLALAWDSEERGVACGPLRQTSAQSKVP